MCGICGFIGEGNRDIILAMTEILTHRGPDEHGIFYQAPIALGHRRLKIIDLTTGQQPLFSADRNFVIVFNGEIYNFQELRRMLEKKKYKFFTNSDTEVLLYSYIEWREKCLKKFNGMFSFAILDLQDKKLFAARDRFGKKPFYYYFTNDLFVFSSELSSLLKHRRIPKNINLSALQQYLFFEYIPSQNSIIENVYKLSGGHYLTLDFSNNFSMKIQEWWLPEFKEEAIIKKNEKDIEQEFIEKLRAATERRLISDVPLGVFLSGGIDSSTIVALMSEKVRTENIKTFSIGFEEKSFDESNYSKIISKHFGTAHYEKILNPQIMIDIIPEIFNKLDEPLADPSIIPTYLLSKFTREYVTVALDGDGGDELLAGYDPFLAHYILRNIVIPKNILNMINFISEKIIRPSDENMSVNFKISHLLKGLNYKTELRNEMWLCSFDIAAQKKLLNCKINENEILKPILELKTENLTIIQKATLCYIKLYLQNDILTKVDRASMMNFLEVRAPFLDAEFAEFTLKLPDKYKIRFANRKYILKKLMKRKLPDVILNRQKKGFGVPLAKWFKKELKNILFDFLIYSKINKIEFFDYNYIKKIVEDHLYQKKDYRKELWTLLVFHFWYEKIKKI
ncbi:MAG TPA: asparagine synthase (glutamine-hydrolyzing) [bacterium]|nr:asparagine synthase (glutamine-hydrolyzing) [bacterium]